MSREQIAAYVEQHAATFLDELKELVAIPSISTLSEHTPDLVLAAEWLAAQLRGEVGLPQVELIAAEGKPLVFAQSLEQPGRPTLLIYGHYDVQPADPLHEWHTPPFEPTVVGDSLFGRGASDDKGPTLATLKALQTLRATTGSLPLNVKVLIEGEEESGGRGIDAFVRNNPERLACDAVLILDTGMIARGVPTITSSLRGMCYLEIVAQGAARDLHSGSYGGIAPNPLQALAWIIADLKGRDGIINVPGLYEPMLPLSDAERRQIEQQSAMAIAPLQESAGISELTGEAGFSPLERKSARPTFEVHGIIGGFVGEGAKTVIPAQATAKVSLRLVPNMQPAAVAELVRQRVATLTPPGITTEVRVLGLGDAMGVPLGAPVMQVAAAVLEAEFGRPVEFVREGGSIPIGALFGSILRAPVVMMGFGLDDDNLHAPNEKFHIPNYYAAIRSVADFISTFAQH